MLKVFLIKINKYNDQLHYKSAIGDISQGDYVILKTYTGEELGEVVKDFGANFCSSCKAEAIGEIVRKATRDDIELLRRKEHDEKEAFHFCLEKIREREIPIKLIRVSFFTNEKKAIFYFTSEGRIDFRELVKDLAKRFKMRIEMRQIGIRDEARMIGGVGICGRQFCCKLFLNRLESITLQMAKKQNINLNPVKISGNCGRLMCCLSYEETVGGRVVIEDQDELVGYNEEDEGEE